MSDPKDPLGQLLTDLTDGKVVDWNAIKSANPNDKELLEQLNAIQNIAQVLGGQQSHLNQSEKPDRPTLFDWGHLQVVEKIGEGSFGEVYRAYDSILDREVALKLLKNEKLAAFQSKAFIAEARRIAKVRHPHVLAVHGANTYENRVGIWTDLIDGLTLSEIKDVGEHFYADNLIRLAHELALALNSVHQAQLVHGDIKPSNVMRDDGGAYVLMDFGAGFDQQKQTGHHQRYTGTPLLMAPELFDGARKSQQSDIYAFGALLFKIATDHYPIEADSIAEVQRAHQQKQYQRLESLRPGLPKAVRRLIHSMLDTDPNKRPSADTIRQQVEHIITAPQRRNKRLALIAVFTSLIIGTTISSVGFYRANEAKKTALEEQQKTETVNTFLHDMLESPISLGGGKDTRVVDLLDYAVENAPEKFAEQPHALASVYAAAARSYKAIKSHQSALENIERSIELSQQLYGQYSEDTLYLQITHAETLSGLEQYEESHNLLSQVITDAKKQDDDYSKIIRLASIRLAESLDHLGKTDEALAIYQDALLYIDDPQTAVNNHSFLALLNTAHAYQSKSQFELAETHALQALDWISAYSEHAEINKMAARNATALAQIFQGKVSEAEPYFRANVASAKKVYGEQNEGYLISIMNLSNLLQELRKLEESMSLQQESAKLARSIFGEKHRRTIMAHMNLANIHVELGDVTQGESLMRSTRETAISELGEDNIQSLMLSYNLAELLNNTQRYAEAESLGRKNYQLSLQTLGEQHYHAWLDLDNVAVSLRGKKQFEEALSAHNQSIDQLTQIVGAKNPYTLVVLTNKVKTLHASGDTQSALIELDNLIALQTEVYGKDNYKTQQSLELKRLWTQ